jgi:hypothetical protein
MEKGAMNKKKLKHNQKLALELRACMSALATKKIRTSRQAGGKQAGRRACRQAGHSKNKTTNKKE